MTSTHLLATAALTLTALSAAARADTIYLVDGSSLDEVTLVDQALDVVTYREKGRSNDQTVESDSILRVEFSRKPQLVDEADSMAADGALIDAVGLFQEFARGVLEGENKKDRQKWAPAYALMRTVELNLSMGNLEGVVSAANKLLESVPESRYVPHAYLAKAEAQRWLERHELAQKTLDEFKALIDEKRLSEGWRLEVKVSELLNDTSLNPEQLRGRLEDVLGSAGRDHPTVASRARVAQGETFLAEDQPDYDAALESFRRIVDDPGADPATLAGAYSGIGDCLYRKTATAMQSRALDEEMAATLREALKAYLRVVVVYADQSRYVQNALLSAGLVFDLFDTDQDRERARSMYKALLRDFPDSQAAQTAQGKL